MSRPVAQLPQSRSLSTREKLTLRYRAEKQAGVLCEEKLVMDYLNSRFKRLPWQAPPYKRREYPEQSLGMTQHEADEYQEHDDIVRDLADAAGGPEPIPFERFTSREMRGQIMFDDDVYVLERVVFDRLRLPNWFKIVMLGFMKQVPARRPLDVVLTLGRMECADDLIRQNIVDQYYVLTRICSAPGVGNRAAYLGVQASVDPDDLVFAVERTLSYMSLIAEILVNGWDTTNNVTVKDGMFVPAKSYEAYRYKCLMSPVLSGGGKKKRRRSPKPRRRKSRR